MIDQRVSENEARFAPGTYGCHEALHLAHVFAELVESRLSEHPAVRLNPRWKALADGAVQSLVGLYQQIGSEHLDAQRSGDR